jgi:branched-chain amino acid transport system substrate-binding protein
MPTRKETKWAVIGADNAWGHGGGDIFVKIAKQNGKAIVSENYPPFGTNDFAPYIQKILDSGTEGLWVLLAGRDAINFIRQASQFGLFGHVFTAGVSFVTDTTVKTLGDMTKGLWAVIHYSSTLDIPQNKKFVADWAKKYPGSEPTNFEGETYIGMQVILQAVRKAGSVKPRDVAKAMEGTTFHTILGEQLMRKEDHQLVGPSFFGHVDTLNGVLRPVVTMTVPKDVATPAPDGSCKLSV